MKCLICPNDATYGEICKDCFVGLKSFRRNTKYLGRAISYLTKKSKLETKHQRRIKRRRRVDLTRLINEQRDDARQ